MKLVDRSVAPERPGSSDSYSVFIDRDTIERQVLGPDRTRFLVSLGGGVDDRWRSEYRTAQLDSTDLFCYRLDLERDVVRFEARGRANDLMFRLDRLADLVAVVNRRASTRPARGGGPRRRS